MDYVEDRGASGNPQEEFIRESFTRICRVYYGVTLVPKVSWHPDNICKVRIVGIRPDVLREFEERVIRAFDCTGFTVLGCTAFPDATPPCHIFEIRSRIAVTPDPSG
jgi:hypothetical protein